MFLVLLFCSIIYAPDVYCRIDNIDNIFYNGENDTQFVIMASETVRPHSVYRVLVHLGRRTRTSTDLRAVMYCDGASVAQAQRGDVSGGHPVPLMLQMPANLPNGKYELKVEGDEVGTFGGTKFIRQKPVTLNLKYLIMLFQLNRPVYNLGQEVKFRVIILDHNLRTYPELVNIYVMDPDQLEVRRWLSQPPLNGMVSMHFRLPALAKLGVWTIRVSARSQSELARVIVESHYVPRYEIIVDTPPHINAMDDYLSGEVSGKFSITKKPVSGYVNIQLYYRTPDEMRAGRNFSISPDNEHVWMRGSHKFRFALRLLRERLGDLDRVELKVVANMQEFFELHNQSAFSVTLVMNSAVRVRFVGGQHMFYKPGLPFAGMVAVNYASGRQLSVEELSRFSLQVVAPSSLTPRTSELYVPSSYTASAARSNYSTWLSEKRYDMFRKTGLFNFVLNIPSDFAEERIELTATLAHDSHANQLTATTSLHRYAKSHHYLQIYSTFDAREHVVKVNEYATFRLLSTFEMRSFVYVVMSKGVMMFFDTVRTSGYSHVFSVAVSLNMAPMFSVIVYHVREADVSDFVFDSISVPIDVINTNKASIEVNTGKDSLIDTVEVICRSAPGSLFALSAVRSEAFQLSADTVITHKSLQRHLYSFDSPTHPFNHHHSSAGFMQDTQFDHVITPNYGGDLLSSLSVARLLFVSSYHGIDELTACNVSRGESQCLYGGCYTHTQRCDSVSDCPYDSADELECGRASTVAQSEWWPDWRQFLLHRQSRHRVVYNERQGDWAWLTRLIQYGSQEEVVLDVPEQDATYLFTGFSINEKYGISIIDEPIPFRTARSFHMRAEMTPECRRGEVVVLRAALTNTMDTELYVLLELAGSAQHRFVHVSGDGQVSHYAPQLAPPGESHQHLVLLRPHQALQVDFPLAIVTQMGLVNITLRADSQADSDVVTKQLIVHPEGVIVRRHTSLLLDLKQHPQVTQYLDLVLDQSPTRNYTSDRSFVFGSPHAHLTFSGDVVGPLFPRGVAMDVGQMFSRRMRSAETFAYNFAINIYALRYLQSNNQFKLSYAHKIFDEININLAALLYYRNESGAYSSTRNSPPSVWLTAWITRILMETFQNDWEDHVYIQKEVVSVSLTWLLKYSQYDGTFVETEEFISENSISGNFSAAKFSKTALTANVLLALIHRQATVLDHYRTRFDTIKYKAANYLRSVVLKSNVVYDIAVATYALSLFSQFNVHREIDHLQKLARKKGNHVYWSQSPIKTNAKNQETNQNDALLPKQQQIADSLAVETTSYALLVLIRHNKGDPDQERAVSWLNSMRMSDGAFTSTTDSLVALQALAKYSKKLSFRHVTDMDFTIRWPSSRLTEHVEMNADNLFRTHRLDVREVYSQIELNIKGSGLAVVQLDIGYGVDTLAGLLRPLPDVTRAHTTAPFSLTVSEQFQSQRNKSVAIVRVCVRWLMTNESTTSGLTVVEVENPSGYAILQSHADTVVRKSQSAAGNAARLAHVISSQTYRYEPSTVWILDTVPSDRRICFSYEIRRWYPVSNMTQYRRSIVYQFDHPERFHMAMVNSSTLYVLNVCQVCGSYQCPYCPFFSLAMPAHASSPLLLTLALVCLRALY